MDGRRARQALGEIERMVATRPPAHGLLQAAADTVRRAVPFDAAALLTTDPATTLFTGGVVDGLPEANCHPYFENELLEDDVAKFADLARARQPAASLAAATNGSLERSARYRTVFAPYGFGDELRAACVDRRGCWAAWALVRGADAPRFSAAETRLVAAASRLVGAGLRAAAIADHVVTEDHGGPGVVVIDARGIPVERTARAAVLLAELDGDRTAERAFVVNDLLVVLAARVRGSGAGVTTAVRAASGRWLRLHASALDARAERVVVVVEVARGADLAGLFAEAHGLTPREREVLQLLCRGLRTAEVAAELVISPYTARDHIRSLLAKVGVGTRRELVATLFGTVHLPRMMAAVQAAHC